MSQQHRVPVITRRGKTERERSGGKRNQIPIRLVRDKGFRALGNSISKVFSKPEGQRREGGGKKHAKTRPKTG